VNEILLSFEAAVDIIVQRDPYLVEVVLLSMRVTLRALFISAVIGFPLGSMIGVFRFPGRPVVVAIVNAFMGLPPVVAGLFVYMLLSRAGPLGQYGILYTPNAMIIAQSILVLPIIVALTNQAIYDLHAEYREQLISLGATRTRMVFTLLWEGRFNLLTTLLAGFGRAIAEVGAVIIVGGNINHATRVMTTTITLETQKGNLELALGLGLILILIVFLINVCALLVRFVATRAGS
jgi:tungstate transport system permease protein